MAGPAVQEDERRWLAWLAVVLWTALILGLGSGGFSADTTSRFLGPLLRWLLPGAAPETLAWAHWGVRKSAHLVEYGVLAWLGWRAARPHLATKIGTGSLVLTLVLAVAVIDEARQSALSARSGSVSDVALDVTGAVLALALLYALRTLRRHRAEARQRAALEA